MARKSPAARFRARVKAFVAAIPAGRVTTYGAIARRLRATPRHVASVLSHFTPEESATLPWFRVVAAGGVISTVKLGAVGRRQIEQLSNEGVAVTFRGRIVGFDRHFWMPART